MLRKKPRQPEVPSRRRGAWLSCGAVYLVAYAVLSCSGHYLYANYGGADNRDTWVPRYCAQRYHSFGGVRGFG